eukprot:SAG11_NODE_3802_length_2216_cov_1.075579_3_plen_202_part_00
MAEDAYSRLPLIEALSGENAQESVAARPDDGGTGQRRMSSQNLLDVQAVPEDEQNVSLTARLCMANACANGCSCWKARRDYNALTGSAEGGGSVHGVSETTLEAQLTGRALRKQFYAMSVALSLNHASVVGCLSLSVSTLGAELGNTSNAALYVTYTSTVRPIPWSKSVVAPSHVSRADTRNDSRVDAGLLVMLAKCMSDS